jgi:hypothetical protein
MRIALRGAGLTLLAAGSLMLAGPALAQQFCPTAADYWRENNLNNLMGRGNVILDPEQVRVEEVNIELAWLGDPATFSCLLAAQIQDGSLRVRGFVPSELVRRRALALARTHTGLRVVDALQVCDDMAVNRRGGWPEELQRGAARLLLQAFPGEASSFQIQAAAGGVVAVAGTVTSREDQLGVSRYLRRLPGCSCVLNQLEVVPAAEVMQTPSPYPYPRGVQLAAYEPPLPPAVGEPYISEGFILYAIDEGPVYMPPWPFVAPPGPPPSPSTLALKQRIEYVCGRAVHDVEVVPQAGNSVQVRFTLCNRIQSDAICAKIMSMPEFAACHVSFEMQADP